MSLENEELDIPRKRLKTSKKREENVLKSENRRLFAPFRALGFVTNHVPFALQVRSYKGATGPPRVHILTCLGRAWAEFEGEKMKLLFVGPDTNTPINSLILNGNSVWVTAGAEAIQYEAGKEIARFSSPLDATLSSILIFGSQVVVLTEDGRYMLVWDAQSGELEATIVFDSTFTAKHLIHPATLLNKVLVASFEGTMELWNIRTRTRIHAFLFSNLDTDLSIKSPITALTESHVTDVVGIGFASGDVLIHDIRADEALLRVRMDGGPITATAFRTDGQEVFATSNSTGHIAFWDLNNKGRLLHIIRGAHDSAISSIQWVPKQPILVSSGHDNSVKQWVFDSLDLPPRLLKYRSGHYSPPHLIRFYGDDGKQLLSASQDRSLRCTSVVRDSRNFELSQGSLNKKATSLSIPLASLKFPPVTAMSFSTSRSKEWDDVLTSHMDDTFARSWSVQNKRNGSFAFSPVDDKTKSAANKVPGIVKEVHVTACGNFGLVGSSTGDIHLWSMQSGLKRKTFDLGPAPEEVDFRFRSTNGKNSKPSPGRCVTGLETDALNKTLVVGTLDGTLNFFNFHSRVLEETLVLPSSVVSIRLQRDSNLLAVICDDLAVRIFDLETKRLVRELTGFKGRVLDISFSHDSRWLLTTSLDSIIRTFDIPTGQLIDAFRTSSVATSISFSPSGDFLASAHVDALGIYLWANRAQYAEVSWRPSSEVEMEASGETALPSIQGSADEEALQGLASIGVIELPNVFSTPAQLDGELITITLFPRARWQTLLHLDVIARRNKPKEPPKAPEKAPFFIPTLPGEGVRFDLEGATNKMSLENGQAKDKQTRRLEKDRTVETLSEFQRILSEEDPDSDYENLFLYLKTLTPAATDLELRLLVTIHYHTLFLRAVTNRLVSHKDFEMVQTLLSVFIRLHGDNLVENAELRENMESLLKILKRETERLRNLVTKSIGTLGFIREVG